jgi:protein-disulfide isomerase
MKKIWFLAPCLLLFALLFTRAVWAADAPAPILLGQANAPITIDEYASLGCPHCADFDMNTLPQLKKTYIDSGKVKIIFHHFPLDKVSLDAALFVQCVPPAQAWDAINLLYFQQQKWVLDPDYQNKLVGYGAMLGLPEAAVKACLSNGKMRDMILQGRVDAVQKLKIEGTPTFIFNHSDQRLMGFQSFDQMVAVINKL